MKGRAAFGSQEFVEMFVRYLSGAGDYIEIGTLFGGSAILAGKYCKGHVYCIDPLDGYYAKGRVDKGTNLLPSPKIVRENWESFGLDLDRLHIYAHKHPPWPEELKNKRFDIGYIDGEHTHEAAMQDWDALKDRVDKYIIFDNTEKRGVMDAFEEAVQHPDWEHVDSAVGIEYAAEVLKKT